MKWSFFALFVTENQCAVTGGGGGVQMCARTILWAESTRENTKQSCFKGKENKVPGRGRLGASENWNGVVWCGENLAQVLKYH